MHFIHIFISPWLRTQTREGLEFGAFTRWIFYRVLGEVISELSGWCGLEAVIWACKRSFNIISRLWIQKKYYCSFTPVYKPQFVITNCTYGESWYLSKPQWNLGQHRPECKLCWVILVTPIASTSHCETDGRIPDRHDNVSTQQVPSHLQTNENKWTTWFFNRTWPCEIKKCIWNKLK